MAAKIARFMKTDPGQSEYLIHGGQFAEQLEGDGRLGQEPFQGLPPFYAKFADIVQHAPPARWFREDSLRRLSVQYLIWLVLSCMAAVFVYAQSVKGLGGVNRLLIVYYAILAMHLLVRAFRNGKAALLSPDVIFIGIYTAFHLGYVNFYAMGLLPINENIFFFNESVTKSLFVIILGLIGFIFGNEIVSPISNGFKDDDRILIPSSAWCKLGLFIMLTALLMHVGTMATVGIDLFLTHGYKAIQQLEEYTSYFWNLIFSQSQVVMAFGISLYTISSALRTGKLFASKISLSLIIAFLTLVVLEGDRGPVVMFVMPIVLVRHYLVKPLSLKFAVPFVCGLLFLFAVMGLARTVILDPVKMVQKYEEEKAETNANWMYPIVELGASFLVVNITTREVPENVPYWMGASWRDAAIHFIPFLQKYAVKWGWSTWAPSTWITRTYFGKDRAGRAFTVAAEGYLNFGYVGAFLELALFGAFIRRLTILYSKKPSATRALIMLGCIAQAMMTIRNHVGLLTTVITQVLVLAFLLKVFLKEYPYPESSV